MRISIFSDTHLGFNYGTRIEDDSFDNFRETITKAINSDLILIAGDIFDKRLPNTEVWDKALKVFSLLQKEEKLDTKLVAGIGKGMEDVLISQNTIPIVALHGTHERTGKGQANAVKVLESGGFVIHLHCNGVIFEKEGRKIAVQGMSGVPERYAFSVLNKWNPKPIKGCYNILMLHQSIEPFVYSPLDPPTFDLSNLPRGFDLIINGHIHTREIKKIDSTTLLLTGSTIVTQQKKEESCIAKGVYHLHLPENKIEFDELENTRKFFYEEIVFGEGVLQEEVETRVEKILSGTFEKKPILRINVLSEVEIPDKEIKQLERKYEDSVMIKIIKKVEKPDIYEKIGLLRKLEESKLSIDEMGMRILEENLEKTNFSKQFDYSRVFNILAEGQVDKAMDIVLGKQKMLSSF